MSAGLLLYIGRPPEANSCAVESAYVCQILLNIRLLRELFNEIDLLKDEPTHFHKVAALLLQQSRDPTASNLLTPHYVRLVNMLKKGAAEDEGGSPVRFGVNNSQGDATEVLLHLMDCLFTYEPTLLNRTFRFLSVQEIVCNGGCRAISLPVNMR